MSTEPAAAQVDANPIAISWYYGELSDGWVTFDARSQKVNGWSEPHRR